MARIPRPKVKSLRLAASSDIKKSLKFNNGVFYRPIDPKSFIPTYYVQ